MFSTELGKKLDKYHLLKHPFYQIYWNEGKLNREIIKDYAEQYYQHVKAFPRYISATHSICEDIEKRRILFPMPLPLASLSAKFFQLFPNPLLTEDQLRLLKYDNIVSEKYKTNFDIGVPSLKLFDQEVKKYCYMWKEGGQYSTEKYTKKNFFE